MHESLILTAALFAATPEPPPPEPFESALDRIEVVSDDDDAQIIAYDSDGDVIGTIAIWIEPDGRVHLASDYADGYAETVVVDGRAQTEASLPPEVIARRSDAMLEILDLGPQEGKIECAAKVILASFTCANFPPGVRGLSTGPHASAFPW